MPPSQNTSRLAYVDNLRAFCMILVVMQHVAVTYSGFGRWYYNEHPAHLDLPATLFFGLFQSHLQAFFMSMFFLIAGYFVPASLEKKGPGAFLIDRLKRLGIPLVVYIFLLHPITIKLIHPEMSLAGYYGRGLLEFDFINWTGPLWFVLTLMVFSFACIPFANRLRTARQAAAGSPLSAAWFWLLISVITLGAFALRLAFPIGTAVANLQFCYFSAYFVLFAVGVVAGTQRGFERISYTSAKRWLIAAFAVGIPLWFSAALVGGAAQGRTDMNGGLNAGAFLNALWESFFCVAFIAALLGIAREKLNFQKPWMRFLSDNTFGVYVFHAIVLVSVSLALKSVALPPVPKFALVSAIAVTASFAVVWMIRLVPPLRRLFA